MVYLKLENARAAFKVKLLTHVLLNLIAKLNTE